MHSFNKVPWILLMGLILTWSIGASNSEAAQDQVENLPRPQGFCGFCHVLTYPEIFNKAYDTWKAGKHNKFGCVECHYPPEALDSGFMSGQTDIGMDIPKGLPKHFTFLELGGTTIKTKPRVVDASCITAACHGNPNDQFKTKKIVVWDKIHFVHETHLLEKNQIPGQQLHCTTCHKHETSGKHFEVAKVECLLCHFAGVQFEQGRAKCELCHDLPEKPVQAEPTDKPITHKMLKEAGVGCVSCHIDLLQNTPGGKVKAIFEQGVLKATPVVEIERIKVENCVRCHDQAADLEKATDKVLMHQSHVAKYNADCFDCHLPIRHAKGEVNQSPLPGGCADCHADPHQDQRTLIAGAGIDDIPPSPDPMFKVRVNCLACHVEEKLTAKGHVVRSASTKTCIQCHSQDYGQMFGMWRTELDRAMQKARDAEKEAAQSITKYESQEDYKQKVAEARNMVELGRKYLDMVVFGNGMHNAKYSGSLLSSAETYFKNAVGYLQGTSTEPQGNFEE